MSQMTTDLFGLS